MPGGDGIYIPIEVIDQFSRALRDFEGKMRRAAAQGGRSLDKIGKEADKTNRKTKALWATIKKETHATTQALSRWARRGAIALAGFAAAGIFAASRFEERMGNVATILSDTGVLDRYKDAVLSMATEGLGSATELADGLYQTISAGVTEPAAALAFLERAAMAAKVGLASTFESVDLGTTILNAFGYSADQAGRVFDEVQVAIREGKTTFAQLAASVGQAAPAFATAELSSGELLAALATLTKGGIDTASAATYLKNTVLQLINPSREAAALMDQLGIEYGAAAFRSRGLAGVLAQIQEKTEGNADALVQIVPNIRAFMAVASLAGTQSEEFARILEAEANAAGELATRWEDVQARADFALGKLKSSLQVAVIEGFTPALEALAEWISQGDNLQRLTETIQALAEATGALFRFIIDYGPQIVAAIGAIFALRIAAKLGAINTALIATEAASASAATAITALQWSLAGLGALLAGLIAGDLIRKALIDPWFRERPREMGALFGSYNLSIREMLAAFAELREAISRGDVVPTDALVPQLREMRNAFREHIEDIEEEIEGFRRRTEDPDWFSGLFAPASRRGGAADTALQNYAEDIARLEEQVRQFAGYVTEIDNLLIQEIPSTFFDSITAAAEEARNKLSDVETEIAALGALELWGGGLTADDQRRLAFLQSLRDHLHQLAKNAAAAVAPTTNVANAANEAAAALSAWDEALERNAGALDKLKSKETELLDAAVRLHREIEINGIEHVSHFSERILELRDDFAAWGVEIPRAVAALVDLVEVTDDVKVSFTRAKDELDKYTAEAYKAQQASMLLSQKVQDLGKAYDVLKGASSALGKGGEGGATTSFFSRLADGMEGAFVDGFDRALHNIGDLWKAFAIGMGDALSKAISNALGSSFWGKILGSIGGSIIGSIGSWLGSLFGGPDSEELAARYGKSLAASFGIAFTTELQNVLLQAGEQLPKVRGKIDAFVAQFMPEVLSHVLGQIDVLTRQFQDRLAGSIRAGVGQLMRVLHIDLAEAMGKYSGIFDEVIARAIAAGHGLSKSMAKLIREAAGLGYELEGVTDQLSAAMNTLIEGGTASEESLAHLVLIAKQLGLSMEEAFGEAFDMAEERLADLEREFRDFGSWAVDWFLRKFSLKDTRKEYREDFIAGEMEAGKTRAEAQANYNELLGIANGIQIDGKHDLRDIRQAIKGRSREEQEVILQLAQQRLEMQAHKDALKAQKKAHRDIQKLIKAQKDLMETLSNLFGMSVADLNKLAGAADSFAGSIGRARKDWQWMYNHPLGLPGGGVGGGVGAQHGLDTVFTGPASGYTVPMELHGRERMQVTPIGRGGTAAPGESREIHFHITSQSPEEWKNYLYYNGGAKEIRDAMIQAGLIPVL